LTPEEEDQLFMLLLADDEEDSPWMVMGDLQFWSASGFAHSLRNYAREQGLAWYVAIMLPIRYEWPNVATKKQLSPDTFVSFVEDRTRTSYDVTEEGAFPPFVLEVVSPSSTARDQGDKRHAYDLLGVREYALFTPREGAPSTLEGYRRDKSGRFVRWEPDAEGRLWSAVLGLYPTVQGAYVQAQTPDGRLLLTPEQAEAALRQAEAAQHDAEAARQRAEEEAERLRRKLERYRDSGR
jgi:Uma2 family endonuclease